MSGEALTDWRGWVCENEGLLHAENGDESTDFKSKHLGSSKHCSTCTNIQTLHPIHTETNNTVHDLSFFIWHWHICNAELTLINLQLQNGKLWLCGWNTGIIFVYLATLIFLKCIRGKGKLGLQFETRQTMAQGGKNKLMKMHQFEAGKQTAPVGKEQFKFINYYFLFFFSR